MSIKREELLALEKEPLDRRFSILSKERRRELPIGTNLTFASHLTSRVHCESQIQSSTRIICLLVVLMILTFA